MQRLHGESFTLLQHRDHAGAVALRHAEDFVQRNPQRSPVLQRLDLHGWEWSKNFFDKSFRNISKYAKPNGVENISKYAKPYVGARPRIVKYPKPDGARSSCGNVLIVIAIKTLGLNGGEFFRGFSYAGQYNTANL